MKCSLRSTRLFVESAFIVLLSGIVLADGVAPAHEPIARAVEQAVRERLGSSASVSVPELSGVRLQTTPKTLAAELDPVTRIGEPARVRLVDAGRSRMRVGEATAVIHVVAHAIRATRKIARGARVRAEDVRTTTADLRGRPLRRLPPLEEVVGARARHDIGVDAVMTLADIAAEPLVHAGDIVRAHVRVGAVEVIGELVAAENGVRDEVIRVVNSESRHATRARVVGDGEVEVVHVR